MAIEYKLLFASLLILILGYFGIFKPVRSLVQSVMSPLQLGFYNFSMSLSQELSFMGNLRNLKSEYVRLKAENEKYVGFAVKVKELERENRILRKQLGAANERVANNLVIADIIGNVFGSSGSRFLINKGRNFSLREGLGVIYENYLIGVIDNVYETTSEVKVINSPDSKITVLSQNSRAKGIVVGDYGINLLMKNVLIDEKLSSGDIIITSGDEKYIPKGLIVGEVKSINFKQEEILKSANLEMLINPQNLETVFVISPKL